MNHTSFIALNKKDQQDMLHDIGVETIDDLFAQIPGTMQTTSFDLPDGMSEMEMTRKLAEQASRNAIDLCTFCGAGFYDHYIPAAIDELSGRSEFYTAYTPYQPEASQGTLQAIYEYQTAIARLTEMDAVNASLYDGGTALFEGMMMALRCTRRQRVLVDKGVNPIYRTMLQSYTRNLNIDYEEIPMKNGLLDREACREKLDKQVGAVLVQNPNFFGCVDDLTDLTSMAHEVGALTVFSVYPISLGLLKTPGAMNADIVTGEGQSLGLPLSFGGPYLGFMATRTKHVRKMPGRIVGATQDKEGRRGYVLTLQAREQHIRREKATSNICSNEALCALRAVMYLSITGRQGFQQIAHTCASRAAYAWKQLTAIDGVEPAFPHSFFNEFALRLPCPASELISRLLQEKVAAGFPVKRYYPDMDHILLLAFTEKRTKEEIDRLVGIVRRIV